MACPPVSVVVHPGFLLPFSHRCHLPPPHWFSWLPSFSGLAVLMLPTPHLTVYPVTILNRVWANHISPSSNTLKVSFSRVYIEKTRVGCVCLFSCVQLFVTSWTVAHQAPLSTAFSRQKYWNRQPVPSPGDHLKPGIKPGSPALQADSLLTEPPGKAKTNLQKYRDVFFPSPTCRPPLSGHRWTWFDWHSLESTSFPSLLQLWAPSHRLCLDHTFPEIRRMNVTGLYSSKGVGGSRLKMKMRRKI